MRASLIPLLFCAAGCAPGPALTQGALAEACRSAAAQPSLVAQLLFGRTRPGGIPVTAAEWADFLATSITPRFPSGLTVLDGNGQWTGRDGRLSRQPMSLVLIATTPSPNALPTLGAIRDEYRARFQQESVGLLLSAGCAAF